MWSLGAELSEQISQATTSAGSSTPFRSAVVKDRLDKWKYVRDAHFLGGWLQYLNGGDHYARHYLAGGNLAPL